MKAAKSQEQPEKSEGDRKNEVGEDHSDTPESVHELGVQYKVQSRREDAEPLLLKASPGRKAKLGPEHPHTVKSLRELVHLYEAWDKPDEAATWRARLPQP